jgi:hypothetical protein
MDMIPNSFNNSLLVMIKAKLAAVDELYRTISNYMAWMSLVTYSFQTHLPFNIWPSRSSPSSASFYSSMPCAARIPYCRHLLYAATSRYYATARSHFALLPDRLRLFVRCSYRLVAAMFWLPPLRDSFRRRTIPCCYTCYCRTVHAAVHANRALAWRTWVLFRFDMRRRAHDNDGERGWIRRCAANARDARLMVNRRRAWRLISGSVQRQ